MFRVWKDTSFSTEHNNNNALGQATVPSHNSKTCANTHTHTHTRPIVETCTWPNIMGEWFEKGTEWSKFYWLFNERFCSIDAADLSSLNKTSKCSYVILICLFFTSTLWPKKCSKVFCFVSSRRWRHVNLKLFIESSPIPQNWCPFCKVNLLFHL